MFGSGLKNRRRRLEELYKAVVHQPRAAVLRAEKYSSPSEKQQAFPSHDKSSER